MRRLLPLLLLTVVAACALPAAARANTSTLVSVMMDDDNLLYRDEATRAATLQRMKLLGAEYVRVTVLWEVAAERAKFDRRGRKRRSFRGENPRTYPRANWDRYDQLVRAAETFGMGVYFNVTGPGPRWAHGKAPRSQRRYARTWKPNAREFGKFVTAVGRRYDGTYADENHGNPVLPRVAFWSIYNEPNQQGWLTPQFERRGSKVIPWSPVMYRELWHHGRAALDRTGHGKDVILIGETAPLGSGLQNPPSPIYPKKFIRELFCLDASGRKYKGSAASKRRCDYLRKIGTFKYTAWAHHPYTKFLAPTERDPKRDAITIANINELSALLDKAATTTDRGPVRNLVAMTEFGYETEPPDPFSGVSLDLQAEYINQGDLIAYRDPRVIANTQFLLKDVAGIRRYKKSDKRHWFTYQSGLYFADGAPKPAAYAYTMPLVLTGRRTDAAGRDAVGFWGWLRFLPNLQPGTSTQVELQFRPAGAGDFTTVGEPVKVEHGMGVFETDRPEVTVGTWRAKWTDPATGVPRYSREVEFEG